VTPTTTVVAAEVVAVAKRVRPTTGAAPSIPAAPDSDDEPEKPPPAKKAKFAPAMDAKIDALWCAKNPTYYPAVIAMVHENGAVDLEYDNRSYWDGAPADVIRESTRNGAKKQKLAHPI
jgi:hypothetical protein